MTGHAATPTAPLPATHRRAHLLLAGALGLAAVATACGSGTTSTAGSTDTSAKAATTTAAAGQTGTTAGTGSSTTKKVNANTASAAEIQAALEANGVTNAARWTKEVLEYRPYPTDDPTLAQLKQNLAKYKPAADQLQKIIDSLEV